MKYYCVQHKKLKNMIVFYISLHLDDLLSHLYLFGVSTFKHPRTVIKDQN